MSYLLTGNVLWSSDKELLAKRGILKFSGLAFSNVLTGHTGEVALSRSALYLTDGNESLQIPLSSITEIYIGFDEICPPSAFKNPGVFWQPLRIRIASDEIETLYMVIDYNLFGAKNQLWFDSIKQLLT